MSALIVVAMCALYALPNIYGEDHAVQISAGRDAVVTQATVDQVKAVLAEKNITPFDRRPRGEQLLGLIAAGRKTQNRVAVMGEEIAVLILCQHTGIGRRKILG